MTTANLTAPRFDPVVVVAAGCIIAMIAFGIRSTMGLFTAPLTEANGWGRETFGLAMALQNLLWGVTQPFAGMLADRWGPSRVIVVGAVVYATGTALMSITGNQVLLYVGGGVLMGIGIAATSFSLIMAAFGRIVPPHRRSWSFGIATAASSAGQFVFAPLGQGFIAAFGWQTALLLLAAIALIAIPLALPLRAGGGGVAPNSAPEPEFGIAETLRRAFGHGSYVLLVFGFFVCGFQVAFITVHMPPYLIQRGVGADVAAWSIALVGLFNIIGSYSSGLYGGRHSRRLGLTWLYLTRSAVTLAFLLIPISNASALVYAAAMGLLWLSTVPLTMGLVTVMFGTRYMATLYGFVFLGHQIGSFLGVWLGGVSYDHYGTYDPVWYGGVALGVFAALVHWPIREQPAHGFGPAPAT